MEICRSKDEMRAARATLGAEGARVGLVPTMGYLHEGHLALIRRAAETCDRVVASIFVNPTQFGPGEDFDAYPRDTDRDLELLREAGVDAVFLPDIATMYPDGSDTHIEVARLSRILVGRLRPGHFQGVATIVMKLLNIVQPHAAFFGMKDFQQLRVIEAMVRDLDMPVEVEGVEIVRESDGLAMSSRNVRLASAHRQAAPALHQALRLGAAAIEDGAGVTEAAERVRARLAAAEGAEIMSVDLRDAETLRPLRGVARSPVVLLLAVRFGDVLLIDNMVATPKESR